MKRFISKMMIIILSLTLVGCGKVKEKDDNHVEIVREENDLIIWSHYEIKEDIKSEFEAKYPGVNIKVQVFNFSEYEDIYLDALATGETPDIMIIDSTNFGYFNSIDAFEDLSSEEYNLMDYKEDFDKELWEVGLSFDRSKLIGLAVATAPIVTYYRADILESYGFPSDPEELGVFMEDPENWLAMGEAFKDDGKYLCQWAADPVSIVNYSLGYFNKELNYIKHNGSRFKEAIKIAKAAKAKEYIGYKDIWIKEGQKAIKDDKYPILTMGSWGADQLKEWVPEQSGKWRVTRLPFNTYGWSNSTLMAIPQKAIEKEMAWNFLEYYTFEKKQDDIIGSVPGYLKFRENGAALENKNEFLGNQYDQKMYESILAKTEEYAVTSLDQSAYKIWEQEVNLGLQYESSVDEILKNIEDRIDELLEEEKESLLGTE